MWAAEASDVSLLHALFYTHSNADLETLIAVGRGAQQDRVTGGSVKMAEAMAAALAERVVLGRPVRRIEHDGDGVRVIARDGSAYRGDAAVVTLPPTLAGRLQYDPRTRRSSLAPGTICSDYCNAAARSETDEAERARLGARMSRIRLRGQSATPRYRIMAGGWPLPWFAPRRSQLPAT